MGDNESRLAKLAELGRETEAEFQSRVEKRAQRILRTVSDWGRDTLAKRYAAALLLAGEIRKTNRMLARGWNMQGDLRERDEALNAAMWRAFGPRVMRDYSRQNGTRKPRGSRMPELDAHIAACLDAKPNATASEIWQSVPDVYDDEHARAGIYRDGGQVVEYHDESERATGRSGFEKRVTAVKKSRKSR